MKRALLIVVGLGTTSGACSRARPTPPPAAVPDASVAAPASVPDTAPVAQASLSGSPIVPALSLAPRPKEPYEWKLKIEGLPALSADGHRAVVVIDQPDGGRGYPSNQLVFVSVDRDVVETKLPLLVADELATQVATISPTEAEAIERKVGRRLELARAELAKTSWMSLARVEPKKPNGAWTTIAGAEVSFASGRLRMRDASSTILLDRDVRAWTTPSYTIRGFSPCKFDPTPTLIAADVARHVLVLVVTQTLTEGGDQCTSANDAHAVRLKQ